MVLVIEKNPASNSTTQNKFSRLLPPFSSQHLSIFVPHHVSFLILSSFYLLLPYHSPLSNLLPLLQTFLHITDQSNIIHHCQSIVYFQYPLIKLSQHPKSAIPSPQLITFYKCYEGFRSPTTVHYQFGYCSAYLLSIM